ncbi:sel1 repeat family protein [Motiliproteus sediminis]|uniref:sel1 repeat family protein n=1 Tax=Motiliproteus sediminis TaxID=1468178 RepID=UPI001AEF6C26|nr:sel1 repeat family protein [Motiliproteus sediminis]
MVTYFKAVCIGFWLALSAAAALAEETLSDTDMALGYYLPLAEQGEPYAQLTIGEIYMEGAGVDADLVSAYAWFYVSLFQGVQEAQPIMEHVFEQMDAATQERAKALAEEYVKAYAVSH